MCQGTFTGDRAILSATLPWLSNSRASLRLWLGLQQLWHPCLRLLLGDCRPVMQSAAGFPGQWGESAGESTPLSPSSPLQEPSVSPILTQSCPPFICVCLFVCLFRGGWDRVSLCSFGACPGTWSIDHAGLKLTEILMPLPPKCWD